MTSEERVLAAAEARVRTGGYNGFSFRDIARDTGLTSAGVHHHFPTKADLVARLAKDYTARFLDALAASPVPERPDRLRTLFAESLERDGKMCLCGLLAAESRGLPAPVVQETRRFFEALVERLEPSFADHPDPRAAALSALAQLEGAALLATTLSDPRVFEAATREGPNRREPTAT